MEKRQLVRTFGTALATATLSFGLFAAPALADDSGTTGTGSSDTSTTTETTAKTIDADGAPVIVVGDNQDDIAVANDLVKVKIPAIITDLKKVGTGSTMTFKASNGTYEQTLTLSYVDNSEEKKDYDTDANFETLDDNKFTFLYDTDKNAQSVITDIIAKVKVGADFLNGEWSLDEIVLRDGNGKKLATVDADATFEVADNKDQKPLAIDVEDIAILKSVVTRANQNVKQQLFVGFKNGTTPTGGVATYSNPAGVEKDYELTPDAQQNATRLQTSITDAAKRLPTDVEGQYTLKSIKIKGVTTPDGATPTTPTTVLETTVTYDNDAFDLSLGDYLVNKTGVEAMIRLYNPWTGEHIYTNDGAEQLAAVIAGWVNEGLAWYAPVNGLYKDAVSPVYRVYNQYNGEHHYTTSINEAASLVAAGWTDEGVGFYTTTKGDVNAQPVYRLFNSYAEVGTHHYTISEDEYNELGELGWTKENVGWYGVKSLD